MHELMSLTFFNQELCSISVITGKTALLTNYEYLCKLAICKLGNFIKNTYSNDTTYENSLFDVLFMNVW